MIKVIIERKISEGFEDYYDKLVSKTLAIAMHSPGYISSEVLMNHYRSNHRIVTTQWSSLYHWHQWQSSPDRDRIVNKIRPVLEEPERVLITRYLSND